MRPICIDWLSAPELDAPGLVRAAADNRVDRVSLIVNPMYPFADRDLAGDTAARRETRRLCRDLGVQVDCMEVLRLHSDTDPRSFRPAFDSGAWLDARTAVVLAFDSDEARLADLLAMTCDVAAEYGIAVVTELNRRFALKSLEDATRLIARNGRTDLGVQIDSMHFYRYGSRCEDIAPHRDLIARAQICDGPLAGPATDEEQMIEGRTNRLLPGDGELPLAEWLAEIPQGIVVALEAPMLRLEVHERLRRGVAQLRALVERVDGTRA
ncbi:TIM barrel protein [Aquibium sp. LZ166]|uniref:TIM barrel protein n=1 Tax=Aquibium pacificus TaxID=3153579 RepID=A0ABV3SBG2_9HYPH